MNAQRIQVECYAGYRGEETPLRFRVGDQPVEVVEVIDRWRTPDHRCFRVRGADGACHVIRHDEMGGVWELVCAERIPCG